MNKVLLCRRLSGAALAALIATAGARASTVTYSEDAANTIVPATTSSVAGVSYTDTSALPQFNPAMGTLTDASFSYNYAATIYVAGSGGAVGQIQGGELYVNGNDTGLAASGGGFGPGGASALSGSFSGTYDDTHLSQDIGLGSVSFAWDTVGDYLTIAYGTPTASLEAASPSPVSVTYTYTATAVPEPVCMSALAIGGLALLGRRRRTN